LLKTEFVPGEPPVLLVQGEVDLCTADQLRLALEQALSIDSAVVVDTAGITFIDAAGLRAVLQVAESRNGRGPLPLVNAPRVEALLRMVGLSDLPSVDIRTEGETRDG
jgi:anti-anti-sigma factor